MRNRYVRAKFGHSKDEIYLACVKLFYIHPEYVDTLARQKLYTLAKKRCVRDIKRDIPRISRAEAESVLRMRCSMSARIRVPQIESYTDVVFTFADEFFK